MITLFARLTGCALVLVAAIWAEAGPAGTLHVSPEGRDEWPGTEAQPFRTLTRARHALRDVPEPERAGATVMVHEGDYYLDRTFELDGSDSGRRNSPVTYRARGRVRLAGGVRLTPGQITSLADPVLRSRLPEAVRDRVVMLDLRELAAEGLLGTYPDLWRDPPALTDVTWNGRMLRLARWPNRDWATVTEVVSERPSVIRYTGDRPARWNVESGVWLHGYWFYEWIDETVRVARIDVGARHIELAKRPPYRGIGDDRRGSLRRFRALNVLEELDEPGEYWLDPERGLALLLPPGDMQDPRVLISTLDAPLVRLTDASYIELHGFVLESGRADGLVIEGGTGNAVVGCEIRNVGDTGIRVSGTRNVVRACDIQHTGATGVSLNGGDRIRLVHAENLVENCDIHHIGRIKQTYSPGIQLSGCGQIARHNRVHDGPHIGILFKENNHLIERNEVDHVCTDSGDVAAIYSANSPGYRGTRIRHNFIHHIPLNVRYGAVGVYLDNALCGNVVEGNVFFRACDSSGRSPNFAAVFIHHGYQNLVTGNLFIHCGRAVGAKLYHDAKWHSYKTNRLKWDKEGARGLDTQAWADAYRDEPLPGYGLAEFLRWSYPDNCLERLNPVRRNVVLGCDSAFGRGLALSANLVTDHAELLRDVATGDLQPRDTDALPDGFLPIPFGDTGLRRDAMRRAVPPRQWSLTPPVADAGRNMVRFDVDGDGVETVSLDGSRSQDPDGKALRSFLWFRKGREIARGAHTVADLPLGEHGISVRAMDRDGYWATDHIRVAVLEAERRNELTAGASPGNPSESIALPDDYRTAVNTALVVSTDEGVLANDGEALGARRVEVLTQTRHGELSCSPDGAFSYTPDPDWEGPDAFHYRIRTAGEYSNTVTVGIAVGVCRGFLWDRSAEWTPGTLVGGSEGNPDDDSLGQPVWFYGSTSDRGEKWFAAEPRLHVWDREWCSQTGNSCWVRADDKGPFFRDKVVFQTDSENFPIIRWRNPTGRRLQLRISGELAVAWFITPKEGTRTTLVVAAEQDGQVRPIFHESTEGTPGDRTVYPVDLTVDIQAEATVIVASRTEDTGGGWVTTTDDMTFTVLSIGEE